MAKFAIQKTLYISDIQDKYIKENCLNFSQWLRKLIDNEINSQLLNTLEGDKIGRLRKHRK